MACRQVVVIFHTQIWEAYSRLEINTPQAKNRYTICYITLSLDLKLQVVKL